VQSVPGLAQIAPFSHCNFSFPTCVQNELIESTTLRNHFHLYIHNLFTSCHSLMCRAGKEQQQGEAGPTEDPSFMPCRKA